MWTAFYPTPSLSRRALKSSTLCLPLINYRRISSGVSRLVSILCVGSHSPAPLVVVCWPILVAMYYLFTHSHPSLFYVVPVLVHLLTHPLTHSSCVPDRRFRRRRRARKVNMGRLRQASGQDSRRQEWGRRDRFICTMEGGYRPPRQLRCPILPFLPLLVTNHSAGWEKRSCQSPGNRVLLEIRG